MKQLFALIAVACAGFAVSAHAADAASAPKAKTAQQEKMTMCNAEAKGKAGDERQAILADARATAEAGAFAVVVEGVAEGLAREITEAIAVPTIGIGASAGCDGQILVTDDMLGLFDWTPKFVRRYGDLRGEIGRAVAAYAEDVRQRRFPGPAEIYFAKAG